MRDTPRPSWRASENPPAALAEGGAGSGWEGGAGGAPGADESAAGGAAGASGRAGDGATDGAETGSRTMTGTGSSAIVWTGAVTPGCATATAVVRSESMTMRKGL
jgi:hypothetical protein